jgi:hypothetical protein
MLDAVPVTFEASPFITDEGTLVVPFPFSRSWELASVGMKQVKRLLVKRGNEDCITYRS